MRESTLRAIAELNAHLYRVAGMVREDGNEVIRDRDHIEIIRHYNHLRLAAASIKESREAISQMEEDLSKVIIPEVMRENKVKTITLEGVGRVTVSYRYSCSMIEKDQALAWLKKNGHGGIVIETVPSPTLSAFAKELVETKNESLPDDLFKTGTNPYTSITKVK